MWKMALQQYYRFPIFAADLPRLNEVWPTKKKKMFKRIEN